MKKKIIAVIGASGLQGGSVVKALKENEEFHVRALSRTPKNYKGTADEVIEADLNNPESLRKALAGVYGIFAVTNFWEPGGVDELQQGQNIVDAAKIAGVKHFIWSTLPNVKVISKDKYQAPHFTIKAEVDYLVGQAHFGFYTFVQAPFYFQNFTGMLTPNPFDDGSKGWMLPVNAAKKCIDMGDINDLGKIVLGAFLQPEKVGNGKYLALSAGTMSFNDVVDILNKQGHHLTFKHVPPATFSSFFEGASEIAQMFQYCEEYSYMGPNAKERVTLANEVSTEKNNDFATWALQNMSAV